jgi:CRP/FNR family transcriptional regulator, dissimilatory nitrate respiration regulator
MLLLEPLMTRPRRVRKGITLFHRGMPVRQLFVVVAGAAELIRQQQDGAAITLHRAIAPSVLAEASLYARDYHCDAIAAEDSQIATLPKPALLARLRSDPLLSESWATHLAREVRQARAIGELLSLRTVSARLDAWLALSDSGLPPRGEWKSVAARIGVSPEALYRELARRMGGPARR